MSFELFIWGCLDFIVSITCFFLIQFPLLSESSYNFPKAPDTSYSLKKALFKVWSGNFLILIFFEDYLDN